MHLGTVSIYRELDRGDGVCRYLKGNLCSIYEDRPLLCRVDESYEIYYKSLISNLNKSYRETMGSCFDPDFVDEATEEDYINAEANGYRTSEAM